MVWYCSLICSECVYVFSYIICHMLGQVLRYVFLSNLLYEVFWNCLRLARHHAIWKVQLPLKENVEIKLEMEIVPSEQHVFDNWRPMLFACKFGWMMYLEKLLTIQWENFLNLQAILGLCLFMLLNMNLWNKPACIFVLTSAKILSPSWQPSKTPVSPRHSFLRTGKCLDGIILSVGKGSHADLKLPNLT